MPQINNCQCPVKMVYTLGSLAKGAEMLENIVSVLTSIAVFIPVITVIVFIHEFGHYFVAKRCKVKIDVFSIGFGKEIFGWNDKSGTRWKLCWLPLGGYVKMFGDVNPASAPDPKMSNLTEEEKKLTFHHKRLSQKAAIVSAGPLANFLLTIVILASFYTVYGKAVYQTAVGEIVAESAAEEAGMKVGDVVLTIDGEKMHTFSDIARVVSLNTGTPITISLLRKGKQQTLTATPKIVETEDALGNTIKVGRLGIVTTEGKFEKLNVFQATGAATVDTYYMAASTLKALGQMVTGKRGLEGLGGPVRIAKYSGQASKQGIKAVLWLVALISVNLGLINLFPIPVLDGGHLLYYVIEVIQGKPLADKFQEYGFRIGLILIVALAIFAFINDFRFL